MDPKETHSPIPTEDEKRFAALSYVWIFSALIFFAKKKSDFVQFHAKKGTLFFGASILLWLWPPARFLEIVLLIIMGIGFYNAFNGKKTSFRDFFSVRKSASD